MIDFTTGIATYGHGFSMSDPSRNEILDPASGKSQVFPTSVEAGTFYYFTDSYSLDPTMQEAKVEVTISYVEHAIIQINFYHNEERLVAVGRNDDHIEGRRREIFMIADDEQLIGCEYHVDKYNNIWGITWLKWKLR